jgi:hypothetical protein
MSWNAWRHVRHRRAWRKHREVPSTQPLVVSPREYRCRAGCALVLWRRRLRLWLQCQYKRRLGQDLVKAFAQKMRALTRRTLVRHPSIWLAKLFENCGRQTVDRVETENGRVNHPAAHLRRPWTTNARKSTSMMIELAPTSLWNRRSVFIVPPGVSELTTGSQSLANSGKCTMRTRHTAVKHSYRDSPCKEAHSALGIDSDRYGQIEYST